MLDWLIHSYIHFTSISHLFCTGGKDAEMNPAQQLLPGTHTTVEVHVCAYTRAHMHAPHTSEHTDRRTRAQETHTHARMPTHTLRHSEQSAGRKSGMLGIQLPRFYIQCCLQPPGDFKHRCLQGPGRYLQCQLEPGCHRLPRVGQTVA